MPNVALRSPWLEQLTKKRTLFPFDRDLHADVVIVGAGIAGVMTAYFLLKKTKKSIVLLEGDRIAHGATGHNAGQLVSYLSARLLILFKSLGQ
jgi:glycine/D-amino acid oxidase-like deaminating enzyme